MPDIKKELVEEKAVKKVAEEQPPAAPPEIAEDIVAEQQTVTPPVDDVSSDFEQRRGNAEAWNAMEILEQEHGPVDFGKTEKPEDIGKMRYEVVDGKVVKRWPRLPRPEVADGERVFTGTIEETDPYVKMQEEEKLHRITSAEKGSWGRVTHGDLSAEQGLEEPLIDPVAGAAAPAGAAAKLGVAGIKAAAKVGAKELGKEILKVGARSGAAATTGLITEFPIGILTQEVLGEDAPNWQQFGLMMAAGAVSGASIEAYAEKKIVDLLVRSGRQFDQRVVQHATAKLLNVWEETGIAAQIRSKFESPTQKILVPWESKTGDIEVIDAPQYHAQAREIIVHSDIKAAVDNGTIGENEGAIIDSVMESFPGYREHFGVRISEQEVMPGVSQIRKHGLKKSEIEEQEQRVTGLLMEEKIGELQEDAKHLAVMFRGSTLGTFAHEFGEFAHARLVTGKEVEEILNPLYREAKATKQTSKERNEWFSDLFEDWWIRGGYRHNVPKEMVPLFRRMVESLKRAYNKIRNKNDIPKELRELFVDLVTTEREINTKYYDTQKEIVGKYIFGLEPDKTRIDNQGFSYNAKTKVSWDPGTQCPKQLAFTEYLQRQIDEGGITYEDLTYTENISALIESAKQAGVEVPCSYCYVENARRKALHLWKQGASITGVRFAQAKLVFSSVPYTDAILKWSPKKIADINKRGGLRMFSFSDYIPALHRESVEKLLADAKKMGLSVKAITKQPAFVEHFGDSGITINASIDMNKAGVEGMKWATAAKLKTKYENVKVRCVARNPEEAEYFLKLNYGGHKEFVDVVTPYHHDNPYEKAPEGWVDMSSGEGKKQLDELVKKYRAEKRVCCQQGGKCYDEKHKLQCASNCGSYAETLTVPRTEEPMDLAAQVTKKPKKEAYPRISDMEWELDFLRKENEELKFKDQKTGLFNEEGERHATASYLERAGDRSGEVTFLRFDLDKFKLYNDTQGHEQGDKALKALGEVLRKIADGKTPIEVRGLASRRTGDEFGMVTMLPKEKVQEVSEQIQEEINKVLAEKGHEGLTVKAGEAYGIEKVPELHAKAEEVLEARKTAAYEEAGAVRRGHEQQAQSLGAAAARDFEADADEVVDGAMRSMSKRAAMRFETKMKELGGDPEKPLIEMVSEREADEFLYGDMRHYEVPEDLPKYAGNINMSRFNSAEDIDAVIFRTDEMQGDIIGEWRGGVETHSTTTRLAEDMGMDEGALIKGWDKAGMTMNARQMTRARMLLTQSAETLQKLAQAVKAEGSVQAKFLFRRQLSIHYAIQARVSGAIAEAGRALQALRIMAKGPMDKAKQIEELMASTKGAGFSGMSEEKLADWISKMDDIQGLNKFTRKAFRASKWDVVYEYWVNALLSSPVTHAVNVTATAMKNFWMVGERAVAGIWGKILPAEDNVQMGEALAMLRGMTEGTKDAYKLLGKAFLESEEGAWAAKKFGFQDALEARFGKSDPDAPTTDMFTKTESIRGRAISAEALEKSGKFGQAIDYMGSIINVPTRMLGIEDMAMKAIAYRSELHALALRTAAQEGLSGDAAAKRIVEILENPPESLHIAATEMGRDATFTRELGDAGKAFSRAINTHIAFKIAVPFFRTPINIAKDIVERSPLGLASERIRGELMMRGARGDLARAKMSLGTMTCLAVGALTAEGFISGGGPLDPRLKQIKENTGWKPYSIKIGDEWISYQRLDPIGGILALSADTTEILLQAAEGDLSEIDLGMLTWAVTVAISQNLGSKTYVRGLADIFRVLGERRVEIATDPDDQKEPAFAKRYIQNLAGSLIPAGVAHAARQVDPVQRDVQTLIEKLKSRIPGLSKSLPARRNIWGEEMVHNSSLGPDAISPFYSSKVKDDPISKEIVRVGVPVGMPPRQIEGVKLTGEEYSRFCEIAGQRAKQYLSDEINYSGWKEIPIDDKARTIRYWFSQARKEARRELKDEFDDLRNRIDDLKAKQENDMVYGRGF